MARMLAETFCWCRVGGASLGDHHQLVTIAMPLFCDILVDADMTDSNCWLFWEMTLGPSHCVQASLRHFWAEPVGCVVVTIPRSPVTGPRHDCGHKMMIVNLWWPYLFWNEFIFFGLFGRQLYWASRKTVQGVVFDCFWSKRPPVDSLTHSFCVNCKFCAVFLVSLPN